MTETEPKEPTNEELMDLYVKAMNEAMKLEALMRKRGLETYLSYED